MTSSPDSLCSFRFRAGCLHPFGNRFRMDRSIENIRKCVKNVDTRDLLTTGDHDVFKTLHTNAIAVSRHVRCH